jgi:hypothetical protein
VVFTGLCLRAQRTCESEITFKLNIPPKAQALLARRELRVLTTGQYSAVAATDATDRPNNDQVLDVPHGEKRDRTAKRSSSS